ncbi:lanthionine synthetase LanC family protein [Sorangium sp. So ce429]
MREASTIDNQAYAPGGLRYENTDAVYHGLAHGASGIGYFLLRLHWASGKEEHLGVARGLLDFELASAEEEREGHLAFRRSIEENVYYPYGRIGGAGVGTVALRFHAALGARSWAERKMERERFTGRRGGGEARAGIRRSNQQPQRWPLRGASMRGGWWCRSGRLRCPVAQN